MSSADYVIVGAGSAGCVLANRLTEDPGVRVLLLEAGGKDRSPNIKIPAAFAQQFHTKLDWDYWSEPEPHCANRKLYLPRGKSLGGSSSMNAMLYVRGRPLDYDLWEQQGAAGWGWSDVRPYFLKAENDERGASEHHGVGGPVNIRNQRSPRRVNRDFLEAAQAAGIPRCADYNGPEQDGCDMFQVFQKHGRRWSAADAYLRPAMKRPNLEVVTHAMVEGLELDGRRVTGVRYRRGRVGRRQTATAAREVILSAGAFGSPQILLLSGIGPAEDLRRVGVPVRHDLPGVGRNLQDHTFITMLFEMSDSHSLYKADAPRNLAEWLLRRSGPLSSTVAESVAFVRTRPGLPAADIQFHVGAAYFERHGEEEFDGHCFVIAPTLLTPRARGHVSLRSADPREHPRIVVNALSEPEDVDSMVAGMRLARRIVGTQPLAAKIVRALKPGGDVADEDLEDHLRERVELIYHPVGTCRMGSDDLAVVDPDTRVRGLQGLRVIDASVMPQITGGNTNAPTMMIAERAADLVRGKVATPVAAAA